jgi:hypothetical protein
MSTKNTLERILNRVPVKEMTNTYILKYEIGDVKHYRLIFNGKKFSNEIELPLTPDEYDDLKDYFPEAENFIVTNCVTIGELSVLYRNLMLDELIETL